jgi:GDPmannose 4,6-dehydratase|tara:strand:- start:1059 stop:2090 length:1032 start_codon:yes stop_codon:yes gene_type:complete
MKTALITGGSGQDGFYLTEFLLEQDYEVHSIIRRSSVDNLSRIKNISSDSNFHTSYGDLTDTSGLLKIIKDTKPDEIYNLAAQSDVRISFDIPEYTGDVDGLGTTRLLECIRTLGIVDTCKFYQASTSELYGKVQEVPQTETTPFYPRSPYGVAKQYSYWMVKNYREAYGMYACNGILFNHESPLRGDNFVTQKIVKGVIDIMLGRKDCLTVGNLNAQRDWGHAADYVKGMWLMMQQDKPEDYVLATGKTHSIKELIEYGFNKYLGVQLQWEEKGVNEIGFDTKENSEYKGILVNCSPEFFRPTEVDLLLGDPTKAEKELGWERQYSFYDLIDEMFEYQLEKE